ncbi:MAG: phytanoyl-CoA dioxygenase family protein [Gammaproteobacteria bacterium]|nr:phytanoyl-CoA dioxygenase family protein [Gammaproteobacteria bacterium]
MADPYAASFLPKDTGDEQLVIQDLNITERIAEIREQGYTVVPDFIAPEEVARIRHAFDTEVPMTRMAAIGTKTGKTLRAHNLLAKTRAVDYLFLDKRIRALVEGILGPATQVNVTTLFNLLPGETKQFLHQDDGLWPIKRPHPSFVCNALIAMDDFDIENGATHIVPYSHRWYDRPVDQSVETLQVEMKSGSMLMWEGGLWHGGGANISKDRERLGFFMSHNVAYLRPQEIQLVSVPREIALRLPEKLQRLLGYHRFGLGVDGRDPIQALRDGNYFNEHAKTKWWSDPRNTEEEEN